ncbi:MAG: DNA translocase FtsK 4TM domain-containing protein, partial [Wenzhouxiangella sp.]
MPRASSKKPAVQDARAVAMARRLSEASFLLILVVALYLLLSLASHDPLDPGWSRAAAEADIRNLGGRLGAWLADLFLFLFGYMAYAAPVLILVLGLRLLRERTEPAGLVEWSVRAGGMVLMVVTGCVLLALQTRGSLPQAGGALGDMLAEPLTSVLGLTGSVLIHLALFLAGTTLLTGLSWIAVVDRTGYWALAGVEGLAGKVNHAREWWHGRQARAVREEVRKQDTIKRKGRAEVKIEPQVEPQVSRREDLRQRQQPLFKNLPEGGLPPLDLLDEPGIQRAGYSEETLKAMSRQVELKLADFGVEAEVVAVHPGPVITRFELQPAPGVKGSQISNLAKDLARALRVISVRVVDVIPGKSVIGLEIPNQNREIVHLREILAAEAYTKASSPLTLGLGKSISGKPLTADISRMPHLLVAGTTGSGKSVAITAMILSLLYKATPDQVRLIMVDPKMLELSVYEGIGHLLTPVVTDMKEAANALRWCVAEMERRYRLMAALGVRNLAGYNRKVLDAIQHNR